MNNKVYFPCYGGCEFNNLKEAVHHVKQIRGGLDTYIEHIIMYNIRFRDCLRSKGIYGVFLMLIKEAPSIAYEIKALKHFKKKWTERLNKHIADYDVQCLPKDYWFQIENCLFEGLNDIDAQVEIYGRIDSLHQKWYSRGECKRNPAGLHIGQLYENYPKFDCFDDSDNRCFTNYVISKQPLTEKKMEEYYTKVERFIDAQMVHEYIPKEFLPILYYNGDSDYVLIATPKYKNTLRYFSL